MYYDYEGGITLTKAQHIKNVRALLEEFAELSDDSLEYNAEKLEALSRFITALSSYTDDDELEAVYHNYQNRFTATLI